MRVDHFELATRIVMKWLVHSLCLSFSWSEDYFLVELMLMAEFEQFLWRLHSKLRCFSVQQLMLFSI